MAGAHANHEPMPGVPYSSRLCEEWCRSAEGRSEGEVAADAIASRSSNLKSQQFMGTKLTLQGPNLPVSFSAGQI